MVWVLDGRSPVRFPGALCPPLPSLPRRSRWGPAGQGRGGAGGGAAAGGSAGGGRARARAGLSGSRRELAGAWAGATGPRAPAPRLQTKGRRAPSASVSGSLLALFLLLLPAPPGVPRALESGEQQGPDFPALSAPQLHLTRDPPPTRPSRHPTRDFASAGRGLRWDPPGPPFGDLFLGAPRAGAVRGSPVWVKRLPLGSPVGGC